MGDPIRALQAAKQISIINQNDLVAHIASIGNALYADLENASNRHQGKMMNLRGQGQGTFIAWDMASAEIRDRLLGRMRVRGVNMAGVSVTFNASPGVLSLRMV